MEINLKVDESMKDIVVFPDSEIGIKIGFTSDKFLGYLCVKGDSVVISLIKSLNQGKGNVRSLIEGLKSKYRNVIVPIASDRLSKILILQGFVVKKWMYDDGSSIDSWVFTNEDIV
jgi:hypothetical protein